MVAASDTCGSETARVTVSASEYATIWFEGTQYSDRGIDSIGTFPVSGLKYGPNERPFSIRSQTGRDSIYNVHLSRKLPFSSVAKWVRSKSLTVSLDSSLIAEKEFFGSYKFDLTKTQWFKGDSVSVGTGIILPVLRTIKDGKYILDEYSLVLFTKDGRAFASCKENGGIPLLSNELENMVPIGPTQKLIATPFGSRVVAGGTSLLYNTPNGGKISIYTIKGELVSKMAVVEDRTVVKLPSTRGMYIVKLEAK
ncbi:hypothetical protein R83H12_02160 [Fibrobacteria bacterium R8-3-H12]